MRPDPYEQIDLLRQTTGLDQVAGTPLPTVDERLETLRIAITDQETPIGPPMRNRPIALKVFALEPRVDQQEQALAVLRAQIVTLTN